ncbi:Reverse transcriptase domain [Cinara cedri]|uniref:Reverse transcriptase domain n=1 Tax=Cinara cedri TaxID=506608 RepID=A0A5E4MKD8_9HEMI|nr:Reverse transcriptase domain [Cinara cedri]
MFGALITKKLSLIISPFICKNQHGFKPKISNSTNIIFYQTKILSALNERVQLDTIYTDFQKAFDKVNHTILLYKLFHFDIRGNFFNWLKSYLRSRTQAVKMSSQVCNDFLVSSSVPQGSHLGPLLFILIINDLSSIIYSSVDVLLFVDEAKLFSVIKTPKS